MRVPAQPSRKKKPSAAAKPKQDASARIYAVVRSIPKGKVATYGQLALLAGIAAGHRIAARAMQSCPSGLPWQRVVGKKDARRGQINIQDEEHARLQRALLEAEGVLFDAHGYIVLRSAGWLPTDIRSRVEARGSSARERRAEDPRASTHARRPGPGARGGAK